MVSNTAVAADTERQNYSCFPITHYLDVVKTCVDCQRPFIFFAKEQKHWYEDLGFTLDSDAVRCVPCRKRRQRIVRMQRRYEKLFHKLDRSIKETVEMADCCLALVETGEFNRRQTSHVRALLKKMPEEIINSERYRQVYTRLIDVETPGWEPRSS